MVFFFDFRSRTPNRSKFSTGLHARVVVVVVVQLTTGIQHEILSFFFLFLPSIIITLLATKRKNVYCRVLQRAGSSFSSFFLSLALAFSRGRQDPVAFHSIV